jgi:protein ImuA
MGKWPMSAQQPSQAKENPQTRQALIASLRTRIAAVERRPAPQFEAGAGREPDAVPFLSPMPGLLHEIHTDEARNAAAALGFGFGLARLVQTPERPALLFLQRVFAGQETGLPYARGLLSFGIDPAGLVIVRVETLAELLWAMEEALACRPVAAVLADLGGTAHGPDFSASRRLSLRAAEGGGTALLLRSGTGREASAARRRWHIAPAGSGADPFDSLAPGQPRWRVRLEKGLPELKDDRDWLVGWTKNGFEHIADKRADTGGPGQPAAVPRSLPAELGDRLAEAARPRSAGRPARAP